MHGPLLHLVPNNSLIITQSIFWAGGRRIINLPIGCRFYKLLWLEHACKKKQRQQYHCSSWRLLRRWAMMMWHLMYQLLAMRCKQKYLGTYLHIQNLGLRFVFREG